MSVPVMVKNEFNKQRDNGVMVEIIKDEKTSPEYAIKGAERERDHLHQTGGVMARKKKKWDLLPVMKGANLQEEKAH